MNEEPQLIDIFAMFALNALIQGYKGESPQSAAESAYDYAAEMMKARKFYTPSTGDSDE